MSERGVFIKLDGETGQIMREIVVLAGQEYEAVMHCLDDLGLEFTPMEKPDSSYLDCFSRERLIAGIRHLAWNLVYEILVDEDRSNALSVLRTPPEKRELVLREICRTACLASDIDPADPVPPRGGSVRYMLPTYMQIASLTFPASKGGDLRLIKSDAQEGE